MNGINKKGNTPLMTAAQLKHFDPVAYFIDQGADVTHKNHADWNVVSNSIETAFRVRSEPREKLIQKILNKNIDINVPLCRGETYLHVAAKGTNHHLVQLPIENGADISKKSANGKTPLLPFIPVDNCNVQIPYLTAEYMPKFNTDSILGLVCDGERISKFRDTISHMSKGRQSIESCLAS